MKILNIVSSNVVQDPRVLKQVETIKSVTDTYLILGKNNERATNERLAKLNFNLKLLGKKIDDTKMVSKIINRIKFAFNVSKEIRKYQPDVIHANDFDVLFIVFLSGYRNAKVVYDAHEIYAKNSNVNRIKVLSSLVQFIEKRIIKKVDSFITVSYAAKEYYLKMGYKKEAHVITNAPMLTDVDLLRQKHKLFEVVYQGQIVSNRGYDEFIHAAKIEKDTRFVIRGFGPLEHELKEIVKKEDINNCFFDSAVEINELIPKLTESHIGVVLTKPVSINYEYTVSNKIFECIHAGLPVILSPVKEHIYLNNRYNFGIVIDEVTPENIAQAVRELKSDHSLYQSLRNNAIQAAHQLNWQKESEKLKALYLTNS
ncbi:glycosyltransferase [Staphylococcus agnetis]|uniref:glycosyltransferase n=1 Tax=Staphylococcus agnetis TaxID=985762 RepID=UPI000CD156B0|nr:glycosyltransferase [Staphylococcus agnetis]NJH67015.1 glycosyltransferase [Staphylococcus agnetis]PNY87717.1 capsular biosynthesis protein [Staphylococcus agnetis]PTH67488.1 capsular biosynthesis protein [Staphylococcus agnetis]